MNLIYLLQAAGLAGLLRYRYARTTDERFVCRAAVALALTVSFIHPDAW